jgi:periplasmic protein CpxP/Spy
MPVSSKSLTKFIAPLLLVGVTVTSAFAQTAPAPPAASGPAPPAASALGPERMRRERPSPETMQRMQDGKIAFALTALKLTPDQMKLWAPVEAQIRARQAERAKMMQSWSERAAGKPGDASPSMSERMNKMAEMMGKRAESAKAFAAVFGPFEASLTPEQKNVLGPVMAGLRGGRGKGGHGGHRWGMNHGGGQPH